MQCIEVLCIEVQGIVVLVAIYKQENMLIRKNRFWACVLFSLDIVLLGILCFLYIIKYIKGEVR